MNNFEKFERKKKSDFRLSNKYTVYGCPKNPTVIEHLCCFRKQEVVCIQTNNQKNITTKLCSLYVPERDFENT